MIGRTVIGAGITALIAFVAGGLGYSATTVFAWGRLATGSAFKAVCFTALIEGVMVLSLLPQPLRLLPKRHQQLLPLHQQLLLKSLTPLTRSLTSANPC